MIALAWHGFHQFFETHIISFIKRLLSYENPEHQSFKGTKLLV